MLDYRVTHVTEQLIFYRHLTFWWKLSNEIFKPTVEEIYVLKGQSREIFFS